MGQFDPIVRVLTGVVPSVRQRIVARKQVPGEAPGGCRVSSPLEQHLDDFTVLVDRSPQISLLASDPNEEFIHKEGVAVSAVPKRSMRVPWSERGAPEADGFVGDEDASLSQQVFDIPMTEIKAVMEPDGLLNDLRGKSVPFVGDWAMYHPGIVTAGPPI